MIENKHTPINVREQLLSIVEVESPKRPEVYGFAIDSIKTSRPEDAIYAKLITQETEVKLGAETVTVPKGSFKFYSTIVEASLLDREGASVIEMLHSAQEGDRPSKKVPRKRGIFNFKQLDGLDAPGLTITGYFHPDEGLFGWDLERTKIQPYIVELGSTDVEQTGLSIEEELELVKELPGHIPIEEIVDGYPQFGRFLQWQETKDFVKAYRDYSRDKKGHEKLDSEPSQEVMVQTFMNIYNIGTSDLQEQGKMPQLVREHYIVDHENEKFHISGHTSSENSNGHLGMGRKLYGNATNPIRDNASWINQVSLSYYMDTWDSLLSAEEVQVLAEALERERLADMQQHPHYRKRAEVLGALISDQDVAVELVA